MSQNKNCGRNCKNPTFTKQQQLQQCDAEETTATDDKMQLTSELNERAVQLIETGLLVKVAELDELARDGRLSLDVFHHLLHSTTSATTDSSSDSTITSPTTNNNKSSRKRSHDNPTGRPSHTVAEHIKLLSDTVRPYLIQLSTDATLLNTWLSLSQPMVQHGHNTGVEIQTKAATKAHNAKLFASSQLTAMSDYMSDRASVLLSATSNTDIVDYTRALSDIDQQHFYTLRQATLESRDYYACLYDFISKNKKKITNPRDDNNNNVDALYGH